jgi:hypothetical protein
MSEFVIVSRHPAVLEWLKRFPNIPTDTLVVIGNASMESVAGKIVIGNVPLHLAAKAKVVLAIEYTGTPPRGLEYTLEDMLKAGATLNGYVVSPISLVDFLTGFLG